MQTTDSKILFQKKKDSKASKKKKEDNQPTNSNRNKVHGVWYEKYKQKSEAHSLEKIISHVWI